VKLKHSDRICRPGTPEASAATNNNDLKTSRIVRTAMVGASLVAATMLAGCGNGHGGSNGHAPAPSPQGLTFTYPYDGQQDVALTSQIVLDFPGSPSSAVASSLSLRAGNRSAKAATAATFTQDSKKTGAIRVTTADPLLPNTTYYVVATQAINGGGSSFANGDTLFQFTTRPAPGRPGQGKFRVTEATPGNTNPVTGRTTVFTQFNTVHIVFSEGVNPATVVAGSSFKFTNAAGNEVPGALRVAGHELTFDPTDDLAPGSYKIALSSDVKSAFGKSLAAYSTSRQVLSYGKPVEQNLTVSSSTDNVAELPTSSLTGQPDNFVTLSNQLIGANLQPASNSPARAGVLTRLAQPNQPGFGDVFPSSIPAGQKFQLTPLSLKLNGDIRTPVNSGPIQVQFGSDANVYLMSNDLRNVVTPTAVRLRFDLNNTTLVSAAPGSPQYIVQALSNGLINQTALNVQAAGLAIPQDNGDLKITTVGTFPLLVNRTDGLTVDFALTFLLPAANQTPVKNDTTAPFVIAQGPSACLYTFGTPAYDGVYGQTGAAPTALPEQSCVGVLQAGRVLDTSSGINDYSVEASPSVVFSEPLDPLSVNASSVQLTGGSGDVNASYEVDGSTITINPTQPLKPDTQYTINLGSGSALRDYAGNTLIGSSQPIKFTTEPLVADSSAAPLLGELSPGVPCALDPARGNFANGGDTAGQCVGDTDNNTASDLPVFKSPANVPVTASFSTLVKRDSVVLADGCLTPGSGKSNTVSGATVALERMDGGGQCTGVAPASLAFGNANSDTTRGFSIRPIDDLAVGSRYWVVVCGNQGSTCTNSIVGANGVALNTDPLSGTGSTPTAPSAAGGPDILMPFDVIARSSDYYAEQFTLPSTDTNGNGQFDDANNDGVYTAGGTDERPQAGNRTLVALSSSLAGQFLPISNPNRPDGKYPAYLSLTRPIVIGKTLNDCSVVDRVTNDNGDPAVGTTPSQCIQVGLLPGGDTALTSIKIGQGALTGLLTQALGLSQIQLAVQNAIAGGNGAAGVGAVGLADPLKSVVAGITGVVGPALGAAPGTPPANIITALSQSGNAPLVGLASTLQSLLDPNTPVNSVDGLLSALQAQLLGGLAGNLASQPYPLQTGRVILRFPNDARDTTQAQSGYIVPECKGMYASGSAYDYAPCFVAALNLTANAPDAQGLAFAQQTITANVVGPVTFEQNGRLVISLRNVNSFALNATALGTLPAKATVNPGDLTYQLVGNEAHGGVAFPQK
jgi:hypothetical protein